MAEEKQIPISEKEIKILLSQWKTCVEMANALSIRRDSMNSLFVTLNLAIIAAISFIWDIKTILLLLTGIIICVIWLFFIQYFKTLNKAKFNIILEIEKNLPIQAFEKEWNIYKSKKKYVEGSFLEKTLPFCFGLVYIIFIIMIFVLKWNVN